MKSSKVVPIKYRNQCLIFSYDKKRRDCYISCKVDEDLKSYYAKCSCWGTYCHEFRFGYIKCLRYESESESKRGDTVYA